jgi:hypothetical protein
MALDDNGTSYTVNNLAPLNGHRTQELILRSTGEHIAEGYLRPYAVVATPSFIPKRSGHSEPTGYPWLRPDSEATLFSFGYSGSGSATSALVDAVNEAEGLRGFSPPLWVDCRISRSVRAAGFRDNAFGRLLGPRYVWMSDLGNVCVQEHREGVEIKKPAAAEELLDLALGDLERRVIFFCWCEIPAHCHRDVIAQLVKKASKRREAHVRLIEWPGGAPTTIRIDVPPKTLGSIAKGSLSLAVPDGMPLAAAASLPWGTQAMLRAADQEIAVLLGPAQFSQRGSHLKVLAVNPGSDDGEAFRRNYGYHAR